jgi:hypothetical protein
MKNLKWTMTLVIFLLSIANATIYENAEDNSTKRWKVLDGIGAIHNIYDDTKKSRVIEFNGNGLDTSYINGYKKNPMPKWNNTQEKSITWSMNYNEDFKVYIRVITKKGFRFLTYTPEDTNRGFDGEKYIYFGLGSDIIDGNWHTINRDLEADLKSVENDNEIISVNGIIFRGSGKVDDIKLFKPQTDMKIYIEEENQVEKVYAIIGDTKKLIKYLYIPDNQDNYYNRYINTTPDDNEISYYTEQDDNKRSYYPKQVAINSKVYFLAIDKNGEINLFSTDGTIQNTISFLDTLSYSFSWEKNLVADNNGTLYFSTSNNYHYNTDDSKQLWVSDGTKEGTHIIKTFDDYYRIEISYFYIINNTLYFLIEHPDYDFMYYSDDSNHVAEIYKSNGTSEGTVSTGIRVREDVIGGAYLRKIKDDKLELSVSTLISGNCEYIVIIDNGKIISKEETCYEE